MPHLIVYVDKQRILIRDEHKLLIGSPAWLIYRCNRYLATHPIQWAPAQKQPPGFPSQPPLGAASQGVPIGRDGALDSQIPVPAGNKLDRTSGLRLSLILMFKSKEQRYQKNCCEKCVGFFPDAAPEKVSGKQRKRKRQRRTLSAAPYKKEKGDDVLEETPNSEVLQSLGLCWFCEIFCFTSFYLVKLWNSLLYYILKSIQEAS